MKDPKDREIERMLETLTPAPPPPGLREKALRGMSEARRIVAPMTPLVRIGLAGCVVLLAIVMGADGLNERKQIARLLEMAEYPVRQVVAPMLTSPGKSCSILCRRVR